MSSSGAISGTPTGTGNFPYEVRVTDSENNTATDGGAVSVTAPPLTLNVPDIAATRNVAFSATASASGGTPGYTYSRASGPNWLSVSSSGTVSGTPDALGNFAYSVTVRDRAGATRTASGTVYVSPPPLEANAPSLSGTIGTELSGTASASGGSPPYAFSKGSGPSWLSIASDGSISGTPDDDGTFSYVVIVADSESASDRDTGSISVAPRPLSATAPDVGTVVNRSISGNASASGGTAPYSYSKASGPSWLSVSSSGAISGTPTASGSFGYSVTVTDAAGSATTASGTVNVNPALSLSVPTDMVAEPGESFSYGVNASGGPTPYSYGLKSEPTWVSISRIGSLTGTPPSTASGLYTFTVSVTDDTGTSVSSSASISVGAGYQRGPPPGG